MHKPRIIIQDYRNTNGRYGYNCDFTFGIKFMDNGVKKGLVIEMSEKELEELVNKVRKYFKE